jgi:hypothetical protein
MVYQRANCDLDGLRLNHLRAIIFSKFGSSAEKLGIWQDAQAFLTSVVGLKVINGV